MPATAGLKTPTALTPVPDQVPPGVETESVTGALFGHRLGTGHIEGSQQVKVSSTQAFALMC